MREALSIRDDVYRLSFRYGNFATLTNLKPWDMERIVEYRLSPLYVSVHATDPTVRRWPPRNPEAPDIIPQLAWFAERGIAFHTQVVLVPGVNDGVELDRTLAALYGLGPAVVSVSVVPVALTEFSNHGLVRELTRDECRAALAAVDRVATRALAERGAPWCFGADDLYLQAGELLPAEAVNDDLVFVDNVRADELAERLPCPVHLSYDFADVLSECGMRNGEGGISGEGRSRGDAYLDIPHSAFRIPNSGEGQG